MAEDTTLARVTTDQATAKRLTDLFAEIYDSDVAVAGYTEVGPGAWQVSLHFGAPPEQEAVRALAALCAGDEIAGAFTFETVAAKDWVAASLEGLPPVPAGRFTVHGAHDRDEVPPSSIGIEVEAALAFGTGHHGTTRGCLIALDGLLRRRRFARALDIGTGTGVLAIAAARAQRRPVLASDIDPSSVRVARENARLNRVGALVAFVTAAGTGSQRIVAGAPYDLIFANILLEPLRRLAAPTVRLLAPHGRMILSGLLIRHENGARDAFAAQGLAVERRIVLDGWVTLVMRRGR